MKPAIFPLGFGGNSLSDPAARPRAERLLDRAWELGVRLFDTAAIYGDSEQLLGAWLRGRQGAVIVSKCGHHEVLPDGRLRSLPISMADIDRALQRLRVECIDAMLLHSYDREPLMAGQAIEVLRAAQKAGKITTWGYSGDNATATAACGFADAGALECSLSLADQANLVGAIPIAAARQALIIAKRPLANAAWQWQHDPRVAPEHPRPYAQRLAQLAFDPQAYGCASWNELALRFTIGCPGISAAVVGTLDENKLTANAIAAAKGPLSAAHMAAICARFTALATNDDWLGLN